MAIQDSFNLSNALNSQSYAYKCWYNYNYGNNTMGISAKDMGEITQTWNSELKNWHATAMDDENAYEIEDDDFYTAQQNGRAQAQEKTGLEDGNTASRWVRSGVDAISGAAGAVGTAATMLGSKVVSNIGANLGGNLVANSAAKVAAGAAKEAGEEVTMEGAKKAVDKVGSWSVAAPLALAQATLYLAKKPNKDEKEACDALQDEMINANNALYSAQEDMSYASDEVTALSDEAQCYNEDANETIEENKSEYDMYKASYEALMEKINSGEQLTDSEKELLKELVPLMQELGIGIQETQEETTETVDDIYSDMGTYQEDYDNAASTVGEVQGLTDYAESFDTSTQTTCYVEAAAQGLNAASGTTAGIQAGIAAAGSLGFNAWAWACAAMGMSAGVISGKGALEQFDWAGQVGTEIGMRKDTQDLNSATNDIYDESIAGYEGSMEGLENFELEMPEDMENPEEVVEQLGEESAETLAKLGTQEGEEPEVGTGLAAGIPTNNNSNNSSNTSGTNSTAQDKDKKEEF